MAKEREYEKMKKAFNMNADYKPGSAFDFDGQEKKRLEKLLDREKKKADDLERERENKKMEKQREKDRKNAEKEQKKLKESEAKAALENPKKAAALKANSPPASRQRDASPKRDNRAKPV